MERDEVYVPWTRSELGIPQPHELNGKIDYEEYFGDTPLYTLFTLVRQQLLAFPAYLREPLQVVYSELAEITDAVYNVSGQRKYPKWTSHLDRA